jgi:inner membrane protein involved in colicin E2 resistance
MSCFIKNIPKNSRVASGNRGIGFPTEAKDCYFEPIDYDCFLALQESQNLSLLTVGRQQIAINCIQEQTTPT